MPYCPNPECPFRKRHGESAEYNEGVIKCSDCGTVLTSADQLGKAVKQKKKFKMHDIYKRLLWTMALLAFWNIVRHFPLPGTNSEVMEMMAKVSGTRISLFALGLMPYITACVVVEIVALFFQPFKGWRLTGGDPGRARLTQTALILTVVFGIIHGRALIWQLGTMSGSSGMSALVENGVAFKSLLVLTLVAAVFFIVWIAAQISAKGVGHGISLILLSGTVGRIPHDIIQTTHRYKGALSSPQFIMPLLTLAGVIALIVYIEKSTWQVPIRYVDGTETAFPIKLTTAGITPVSWAYSLLVIPILFIPWNEAINSATRPVAAWITGNLFQGSPIHTAASAILIIVIYFVFTALFFNPSEMIDYLRERHASVIPNETDGRKIISRGLESMALIGSLYLVFVYLSLQVIWWLVETDVTRVSGISLIVAVCITLDLTSESLFRWRSGGLVRIAEFQEPWKAGLLRSLLEKESIPCTVRGYYYRSLLYLFGPYIEMTVFVDGSNEIAARAVINKYLDNLEAG